MNMKPLTWVEISRQNLLHNLAQLSSRLNSKKTQVLAVIKGNAYGHGLLEVARVLDKKVTWFGVNNIEEGLSLRRQGFGQKILILGYVAGELLGQAIENNLRFAVYNRETVERAAREAEKLKKKAIVHLKIETGTNRQGIRVEDVTSFAKFCQDKKVVVEGVYTHFADIEDRLDHSFAMSQLAKFTLVQTRLKKAGFNLLLYHAAPTAGAILFPQTHFDLVRLGIGLYGLWPSKETRLAAKLSRLPQLDLRPVLTWKTRLVQIKEVGSGESIGYGRTFITARKSKIGILPVGYFDGYDRRLSNKAYVLIGRKPSPVVGRVAMNMIAVDLTDLGNVVLEEEAVLLGKQKKGQITADQLADWSETINYEIVSRINPNLPRIVR